jgi:plastocyanin
MVRRALFAAVLATATFGLPSNALAGGGGCTELTAGSGTTVEILYSCLTPTLIRVDPGATVTFVNRDDYRHVIAGAGYAWSSDGYLRADDAFAATFRRNGVYPFQCYLHPGMAGAVIVGDGSGLGAAQSGDVVVEPLEIPEEPLPEVVYLTRAPEIRTVRASSAPAWTAGIAVGLATGLLIALAGAALLRRHHSAGMG